MTADTVSVTQALLMARSWLPHAGDCAAVNPKPTGDGYDAECTCGLTEKLQVIDSARASTQPAPAFPRDEVEEADLFQAIHEAMADERNGAPDGDIIVKGCEAAGYCDPESAADAFKAAAVQAIAALLQGKQP